MYFTIRGKNKNLLARNSDQYRDNIKYILREIVLNNLS